MFTAGKRFTLRSNASRRIYTFHTTSDLYNNCVIIFENPAATTERQNSSLFLKRDEGSGEGKNFFSREKKFFPSPEYLSLSGTARFEKALHDLFG